MFYEDHKSHVCEIAAGQFSIAPNPAPAPNTAESPSVTPEEAMRQISKVEISPEIERTGTLFLKSKMKSSAAEKTALLKTGGTVQQFVFAV